MSDLLPAFDVQLWVIHDEGEPAWKWSQLNVRAPDRWRAAWVAEHLVREQVRRRVLGRYPHDVISGYVDPAPLRLPV